MSEQLTTTVGAIVAADRRTAAVFERSGIRALDTIAESSEVEDDMTRWPIPRLVDFIVSTHHVYIRALMPTIAQSLKTLEETCGSRHPELSRVTAYLEQMCGDLAHHMLKEEQVLFPYVRDLAERLESCGRMRSPFGTVENPIRMMEREHHDVADAMRIIGELTHGYTTPADACTTYAICMAQLRDFERDLHRHMHLENNVLFPAAVELEQRMLGCGE